MLNFTLGAAALNQTPLDWKGNMTRIESVIRSAENWGCDLLCLPELCITGYGCEDMFLAQYVLDKAKRQLVDLALRLRSRRTPIIAVGLPVAHGGSVYNCVAVIEQGHIRGIVPKQNLARDGVHYEPRWFLPWKAGKVSEVKLDEWGTVPFGDLIFEVHYYPRNSVRFGFEICEDAWVASRPGSRLAQHNVDVILNPSASHFGIGKHDTRRLFVSEGSRKFNCAYVYANLLGNESGRLIFDGATLIASGGKIVNEGKRLSFRESQLTTQKVDLEPNRVQRRSRQGFEEGDSGTVIALKDPSTNITGHSTISQTVDLNPFEEFTRAVALGLFDYMRKSHTKGYVVSLSGGADSSAVAVLVAEMVRLALTEPDCLPKIAGWDVENLLTCIYQPTKYSSEETSSSAQRLASSIGARFMTIPVNKVFERYKEIVGEALDLEWSWEEHDVPLQNIQARLRSPSAWMVANVLDQILLSTSNRSEAAVGYATMDGDTSGGLAPIAGIGKAFLLRWLKWMEDRYPGLDEVNALTPTAELKPSEANQTDEGDLMPYVVLDTIKHHAIKDKQSPNDILIKLVRECPYYSTEELSAWITKFYKLWCRNQWKRERYAPAFHVDEKNLDPKTACRFPILSSGLEEELKRIEMRGHDD